MNANVDTHTLDSTPPRRDAHEERSNPLPIITIRLRLLVVVCCLRLQQAAMCRDSRAMLIMEKKQPEPKAAYHNIRTQFIQMNMHWALGIHCTEHTSTASATQKRNITMCECISARLGSSPISFPFIIIYC